LGVMANPMLLITLVSLAESVSWLIKAVGPGFCPVIVMVVSSACVANAFRANKNRAITVIIERDFMSVLVFVGEAASWTISPWQKTRGLKRKK